MIAEIKNYLEERDLVINIEKQKFISRKEEKKKESRNGDGEEKR